MPANVAVTVAEQANLAARRVWMHREEMEIDSTLGVKRTSCISRIRSASKVMEP
jgi:hypothetical protein